MFFLAEQVGEYDKKHAEFSGGIQLSIMIASESDGIQWLRQELKRPRTYQELHPIWTKAISGIRKGDVLPELKSILEENFLKDDEGKWRTPNPNEAKDIDLLRLKALLREFNNYVQLVSQPKAKKLKEVRIEALKAGFQLLWEKKDFKTVVFLGDMIPQNILLEDEHLLMYYDIAKDRA